MTKSRRRLRSRKPSRIQSLILQKERFDKSAAAEWLRAHGFKSGLDEKSRTFRARPSKYISLSGPGANVWLQVGFGSNEYVYRCAGTSLARRRASRSNGELFASRARQYRVELSYREFPCQPLDARAFARRRAPLRPADAGAARR